MKKLLTLLILTGIIQASTAQLTPENAPNLGEVQLMYFLDSTTTAYADIIGEEAYWDYSTASSNIGVPTKMVKTIAPNQTPYESDFSSSSHAFEIEGFLTLFYTQSTESRICQGFAFIEPTVGLIKAKFSSDPALFVQYPMGFGGAPIQDNFAGTAHLVYSGLNLNPDLSGSLEAKIDGVGTLKLRQNSYENVIRYKLTDNMAASVALIGDITVSRTQYEYYDFTVSKMPVFIHISIYMNGGPIDNVTENVILSIEDPTAPSCADITGLTLLDVTHQGASIAWNGNASYNYQYVLNQNPENPESNDDFSPLIGNAIDFNELTYGETYYFHIRKDCGEDDFSTWATISFTPGEGLPACEVATNITANYITHHSVVITWEEESLNNFEYVLDNISANPTASGINITGNGISLSELTPNTVYFFHIRRKCSETTYSPWNTIFFVTEPDSSLEVKTIEQTSIELFPNPSSDNVFITGISKETTFILYDLSGEKIIQKTLTESDSNISLKNLPKGIYILRNEEGKMQRKIVKNE